MVPAYKLLLHNAHQIVQVTDRADCSVLRGTEQGNIKILGGGNDATRYSLLVAEDGTIVAVGTDDVVNSLITYNSATVDRRIDVRGGILMPGLIDGHTHAVFAGDRVHEFAMKLAGATYMQVGVVRRCIAFSSRFLTAQIHAAGGGIHFTVDAVRKATLDTLCADLMDRCRAMLATGTTTVEVKSGYGLDAENELKMLRAIEMVGSCQNGTDYSRHRWTGT